MRKRLLISSLLGGTMALASFASADLAAGVAIAPVFRGTDVDTVNGGVTSGGPAEFDTLAVRPDGTTVYLFDSIGTADGIIAYTGGVASMFAAENQLTAGSASAGDLDADATNVYTSIFDGSKQRIWRIPHAGGFGSAAELVDSTGSVTANMGQIQVDADNSRLIIAYNDAFNAVAEDIVHVPLNATNATPTALVTEAQLETALSGITGYVDDTSDDVNIYDLTVQSNGDIIASHGFSSNRQINGSLLKITETGTVSVFRTADEIITAAGVDPSLVDIGSVNVEALSEDEILIMVTFSSANGTLAPFIAVVSADGTSQQHIGTEAEFTTALGTGVTDTLIPVGQFLFRFDSKDAGDVDAADNLYIFRQASPSTSAPPEQSAVLQITGIRSFLTATSVESWMNY